MKVFRVEHRSAAGESLGFSHHTSKRQANQSTAPEYPKEGETREIEEIQVEVTAKGILAALNKYASHPDNG